MAVNLFPPTLADLDLPVLLGHAPEGVGLTSSALAVEITEEFMLGNLDRARIVLTGLHRLGIRIAIDDFGSGYCLPYYLHELPIDEVKGWCATKTRCVGLSTPSLAPPTS